MPFDPSISTNQPSVNYGSMGLGNDDAAPLQQGQYNGQTVIVERDPNSEIADAAEELTFAHSEHVEKDLKERKVESRGLHSAQAAEKAEMYMEKLKEAENQDKINSFIQKLKQERPNPDQILKGLRNFFKEPSEEHAVLSFLKDFFSGQEGEEGLIENLDEAQKQLETEFNGNEVAVRKAGEGASKLNLDPHTQEELESFHRDSSLGYANVLDTYNELIKRYGEERFPEALSFLIRTTGNEMQSGSAGVSEEKLRTMVDDLFHVQVLGNVQFSLKNLAEKVANQFSVKAQSSTLDMMKSMLALTQNAYSRGDQVYAIAKQAGFISNVEAGIYFLTALKDHLRLVPLKIYPNPDNRAKLMDAAQEALDKAIEEEGG